MCDLLLFLCCGNAETVKRTFVINESVLPILAGRKIQTHARKTVPFLVLPIGFGTQDDSVSLVNRSECGVVC